MNDGGQGASSETLRMKFGMTFVTAKMWSVQQARKESTRILLDLLPSLPARTVLWLDVILKSLPLRLRVDSGPATSLRPKKGHKDVYVREPEEGRN